MALPANVDFGTVTGTFIDSAGTAIEGSVTFTPSPSRLLDSGATPATTILPKPVTVTLNGGSFTQALVATDDTDLNPSGWTYAVSFKLTNASAAGFSIAVPAGETIDLTLVSPVASSAGQTIIQGPGVASGGTTGQILAKASGTVYDTEWVDAPEGTGGGGTALTSYVSQVESLSDYPDTFPPDTSSLAAVATSGSYNDLTDKPSSTPTAWDDVTGKPAVIAAGATQADARAAIGAGTSNLALGTTSSTAKAGDYQPTAANISDATTVGRNVLKAADAAAARTAIGAGTSSFDGAYGSLTGTPTIPNLSDVGIGTGTNQISGFWAGTQTEYDAIGTKDATTFYLIVEE